LSPVCVFALHVESLA